MGCPRQRRCGVLPLSLLLVAFAVWAGEGVEIEDTLVEGLAETEVAWKTRKDVSLVKQGMNPFYRRRRSAYKMPSNSRSAGGQLRRRTSLFKKGMSVFYRRRRTKSVTADAKMPRNRRRRSSLVKGKMQAFYSRRRGAVSYRRRRSLNKRNKDRFAYATGNKGKRAKLEAKNRLPPKPKTPEIRRSGATSVKTRAMQRFQEVSAAKKTSRMKAKAMLKMPIQAKKLPDWEGYECDRACGSSHPMCKRELRKDPAAKDTDMAPDSVLTEHKTYRTPCMLAYEKAQYQRVPCGNGCNGCARFCKKSDTTPVEARSKTFGAPRAGGLVVSAASRKSLKGSCPTWLTQMQNATAGKADMRTKVAWGFVAKESAPAAVINGSTVTSFCGFLMTKTKVPKVVPKTLSPCQSTSCKRGWRPIVVPAVPCAGCKVCARFCEKGDRRADISKGYTFVADYEAFTTVQTSLKLGGALADQSKLRAAIGWVTAFATNTTANVTQFYPAQWKKKEKLSGGRRHAVEANYRGGSTDEDTVRDIGESVGAPGFAMEGSLKLNVENGAQSKHAQSTSAAIRTNSPTA